MRPWTGSRCSSGYAYLQAAQGTGDCCEALVESDQGLATFFGFGEMKCLSEVHSAPGAIQCSGDHGGVFKRDAAARLGGERSDDLVAGEPVTAPQDPLGFKQNGRTDIDIRRSAL